MSIDAMFKRANAAKQAGRWAEAERGFRALTKLKPSWAFHNLGVVYLETGRIAQAEEAFRAALAAEPTLPDSRHSLAMLLLSTGRYAEGWALYEARRRLPALRIPTPRPGCPEWRGEDLAGKRLLVIKEQGLGDQIMLARFIPQLEARGAKVTLLCDPPLAPLFQANGVAAISTAASNDYPPADLWTLMFSVPGHLGVTLETLSGAPYVRADHAGTGGGIGVKPRGGTGHVNDRYRSLSQSAAAALLELGRDLDPASTGAGDFLETARIVAGLDHVVTVDTAVAHLAGAMGKPCFVLLSATHTDWRWMHGRDDSPWYDSVRLFRQATPGDWRGVIAEVRQALGR